jgi:hypothetical protein
MHKGSEFLVRFAKRCPRPVTLLAGFDVAPYQGPIVPFLMLCEDEAIFIADAKPRNYVRDI